METKEQPTVLTLEILKDAAFGDIQTALNFVKPFYLPYPEKPAKPSINPKATSIEARQYVDSLEGFEKKMVEYEKQKRAYSESQGKVNGVIEEYIKDLAGFNNLPEKSKPKVWSKAWDDGHSSGYHQVYYCLRELVDLFE